MLHDVRRAARIGVGSAEREREKIFRIVVQKMKNFQASFFVPKKKRGGIAIRDFRFVYKFEIFV